MGPKVQLLARASGPLAAERFGARVTGELAPVLLSCCAGPVKLTLTDLDPPRRSVIPFSRERVALFSLWTEQDVEPLASALAQDGLRVWGYRVQESVPRAYERDWPTGGQTPGVGLLTVFNRKRGLDDSAFLQRWHGGHTPLTLARRLPHSHFPVLSSRSHARHSRRPCSGSVASGAIGFSSITCK